MDGVKEREGQMERKVCPGEIYRHFKGNLYQIVTVARHSETGEAMVVYQALYGDFGVYVRPFEMFFSQVDREKYPDAAQKYRFEKAEGIKERGKESFSSSVEIREEGEEEPNGELMAFLDAKDAEEKFARLRRLNQSASLSDLESIYVVLDLKPQPGTIEEQLEGIIGFLAVQKRYEGGRLR